MIPSTGPAHLDDVHRELPMVGGELLELVRCARRPGHLAQALAEHPGHLGQFLLAADRAGAVDRFAVEPGGTLEVGIRVADPGERGPSGVDVGQQRTALQGVVHHLSRAEHPTSVRARGTRHGPAADARTGAM